MKHSIFIASITFALLSGCSSNDNACEDITLASEQIQECQSLQRQIANAKGQPLIRTELERRYQTDCIDIRFYRDAKKTEACDMDVVPEDKKN